MSKASKKKESLRQCIVWFIIIALIALVITGIPYEIWLYIFSVVPTEILCVILGTVAVILAFISVYLEYKRSRNEVNKSETERVESD